MKKYKFSFIGRQSGAIGINYAINDTYNAKDIHEALSLLWTDYDMVRGLSITENGKPVGQPTEIKWVTVRPYTERERSPKTGTYRYTRNDAPKDYNY